MSPDSLSRRIDVRIQFMWDDTFWTDETDNFISASGALEFLPPNLAYQRNRPIVQQMKVTMSNPGLTYSPYQPGSTLWQYRDQGGAYLKKCRLQIQEDGGEWETVFFGYIKTPQENFARNQMSFTVWDKGETLRRQHSSPLYQNLKEHEVVVQYLQIAGLADGVDFVSPAHAEANGVEATIDFCPTPIRYTWLDDEEIWDELAAIAQASGAMIFVGTDDRIYYRRSWRWAFAGNPEILTLGDFTEPVPKYDDKAFYDKVVIDYSSRYAGDKDQDLWALKKPKVIKPGETETITARLGSPALVLLDPEQGEDYSITFFNNADAYASITLAPYEINAQQVKITISNDHSTKPVVVQKFILKGQGIVGSPSEQYEVEIDTPRHDRKLEMRGNPYVAHEYQAATVAHFLAWWYESPKPIYTLGGLRGKTTRTLGNALQFPMGDATIAGVMTRIEWSVSVTSTGAYQYQQSITMLDNSSLSGEDYFIIGEDEYSLGAGFSQKRLWH